MHACNFALVKVSKHGYRCSRDAKLQKDAGNKFTATKWASLKPYCPLSIAGITGILLFIIMMIIFIFSHPIIRQKAYKFFWKTHSLYILLYALSLVHGLARLTGSPRFWMFFIGPATVFAIDKVRCCNF